MKSKFDLVIFDLDGTLFDTKRSILKTVRYVVESQSLRRLTDEEVRSFLGPPLEYSFGKSYPDFTEDRIQELVEVFREHYFNVELLDTELYPGMMDVLEILKEHHVKIALATYKLTACINPLFEHFGILKYFDSLKGSEFGITQTKVDIMNKAIYECDVRDLRKICMVGDTEHDFRGAIHCGINFIGMTYGFGYTGMNDDELKYKEFLGYCDSANEILSKIFV